MRIFPGLIVILFTLTCVNGQDLSNTNWYDGSVTMVSGEKLTGKVLYDVKSKTVQVGVEDEIRSLKASKVSTFEFNDKKLNRKRLFISLPLEVPNRSSLRNEFLELIKDFGDWEILSHLSSRKVVLPAHRYIPAQTVIQTIEQWFIIEADGSRHLYFSFIQRPLLGPKLEFFNAMLFKQIIASNAAKIKEYASLNKLDNEKPAENILLLEYNEQLNTAKRLKEQSILGKD